MYRLSEIWRRDAETCIITDGSQDCPVHVRVQCFMRSIGDGRSDTRMANSIGETICGC